MNSTRDQIDMESRKDPESLEREIDQQRDTIGNIVSALENKLSPGEIVDRVMRASKGTGGEFARNLGNVVRANPMPTLLTSVGLVWLYASRSDTAPVHEPARQYGRSYSAMGASSTGGSASYGEDEDSSSGGVVSGIKDKVSHVGQGVSQRASDLRHGASHKLHDARDRVGQGAHSAAEALRNQTQRAKSGVSHMMEENPMVIGAIAIGIGALLGAALPVTEKEDRLMGETGDKLRSKAGQATQVVREKGKEVVQSVRETGSNTVQELGQGSSASSSQGGQSGSAYGSASSSMGGLGSAGGMSSPGLGSTSGSTPGGSTL